LVPFFLGIFILFFSRAPPFVFAYGDDDDGVDAHIYRHRLIIFIRVYYDRLAALLKLFPTGCGILVLWCQSQTETVGRRFISTV
jgi:hypothetical protein